MKFGVIGVGRFGYQVAVTLADHGMEVLAVDSNESIIASIRDKVTQAITLRVSDEDDLRSIGMEQMDTVIVAMGENFAQSILVTALLKQRLKIPVVIVRSISEIHKDILKLIGADQVILPEKEMGLRLADNLSLPFNSLMRITSHFSIAQFTVPRKFVGKTIEEINFVEHYHIQCIGQKVGEEVDLLPSDYRVKENDIIICAGLNRDLARFVKL